jgi:hypothetical protein
VAVYDVGRNSDGLPFVVMEYVEGRSLKEMLKTGRPSYGTETVVLLAGDRPLPAEVDVQRLSADMPSQRMLDPRRAIWFAAGRPITKAEDSARGIDLSESPPIDDPVLETQRSPPTTHDRARERP